MRNMCRAQSAWMRALAIGLLVLASTPASAATGDTLAVYQLTAGWATFGLVLPRGEAFGAVQVGKLPTQTDVKSRWDDNSIKSAIVSANVPADGHYALVAAEASPATPFVPAGTSFPPIIVELTIHDGPSPGLYKAVFAPGSLDKWLSGPLVSEARLLAQPTLQGTQTISPSLRVVFDARSYVSGGHRIDVAVENTIDSPAADAFTYDVKILVDGDIKFEKPDVLHRYLARWRQVVTTTGLALSEVTPDFGPFIRARALPNYMRSVDPVARAITAGDDQVPDVLLPEFEILQVGHLMRPMNAHAGRPEIAPYPDWTAQAIVHRQRGQLDYVLKHGELAGSWGVHIKKGNGTDLISIDERPNFWLDARANDFGAFNGPTNNLRGQADNDRVDDDPATEENEFDGTSATRGDIAHQPSLAYVPYLITGDRYFLDEVMYWANYVLIGTYQDEDQNLRGGGYVDANKTPRYPEGGSRGLIVFNEVRGIGWGLRNLADAAFIVPEADLIPDDQQTFDPYTRYKAYFTNKVSNNLIWLDDYAKTFNAGPVMAMFPNRRPEDLEGTWMPYAWIALWEQRYVGWAVDHARLLGFSGGVDFLTRLANFEIKLYTSAPDVFSREWAGIYVLAIGEHKNPDNRFEVTYFQTLQKVFEISSTAKSNPANTIGDFYRPFEGVYGPESRLMLMVARGLGLEGAEEAYAFLMGHADDVWPNGTEGGHVTMQQDLNRRSGWAIGIGGVNPLLTDVVPSRPNPAVLGAATATNPIQ